MKVSADSLLGRLALAARPRRPWLRVTVSPWWARVLIAAGAQPAPDMIVTYPPDQPPSSRPQQREAEADNTAGAHPKVMLGSYSSRDAAQHAVDVLMQHEFPVEHVTIVGFGLRLEKQVRGRWTRGKARLAGATSGALIGLLMGLVVC